VATCPECGYDWELAPVDIVAELRAVVVTPAGDISVVRTRPEPDTWSALEYAAHLRDALQFYEDRIRRTLIEDGPRLEPYDFHDACDRLQYNAGSPSRTAAELDVRAHSLATLLAGLDARQWSRTSIGSDGGERTVLTLARRATHEVLHHALDIRRVLQAVAEAHPAD
jgi:hypothetical protein